MIHQLPPLPEPDHVFDVVLGVAVFTEDGYTEKQMHEYALEAIRQHEARRKESQERSAKFNAEQIASYGRSR